MKLRAFLSAMLASAVLVGCSSSDVEDSPSQPPVVEQTQLLLKGAIDALNNVDVTRLNAEGFEDNDKIGVYVSTTSGLNATENYVHNAQYSYNSSTKAITSSNAVYWSSEFAALSIYAYYPYNAEVDNVQEYAFAVKTDQSAEANYYGSDFVWAEKRGVEAQSEAVELTFAHSLSLVNVYLRAGNGVTEEELDRATVTIEDVATSGHIDLGTGVATADASLGEVVPNKIAERSFSAVVYPQSAQICVKVVFDGKEYIYEATTREFASAKRYNYYLTLSKNNTLALVSNDVTNWTNGGAETGVLYGSIEDMVNAIAVTATLPYSVFPNNSYGFDFGLPGVMCATDAATGDVVGTSGDDNSGYNWFWFWGVGKYPNSNRAPSQFEWNIYTNLIRLTNNVIGTIGAEPATDDMKAYLAYAKAYRASFYLDMARAYDPLENNYTDVSAVRGLTVPIVTEATTEEEACNNPRASREDMFTFILDDLTDAEALLTGNSFSAGRTVPTLGVVYGLMARAYLWLGGFDSTNYAQAATYARKALDTSQAKTLTESQWLDPKTGFNTPNASWMWYLPQTSGSITNLANFVAWRSSEATWGYGSRVHQGVHPNFYNRMSDTDWRKRAFVGDDVMAWYDVNKDICNLDLTSEAYEDYFYPYQSVKFRPAGGETKEYTIGNVTSICVMRAEEMILTEIEALAYTDPTTAAAKLREFMLTRDYSYSFAGTTTEEVVEETIWQKRVELWGEGVVFYDMKRLNYSIETGYEGTNVATDSRMVTDGRAPWWNFFIPETAALQNSVLMTTNNPDPCNIVDVWKE